MIMVYNTFNNEDTIRDSLLSVLSYVDRVIVLDGAYRRFPHENRSGASNDTTQKICRQLCKSKLTWVGCRRPWRNQVAKKTALLKLIPNGKWFLRIAADEVLKGKIAKAFRFAKQSNLTNIGVRLVNYHPVWKGYKVHSISGHAYVKLDPPIPREVWSSLNWTRYEGVANRIVRKQRGLHFQGHHSRMYLSSKLMRIQTTMQNVWIINLPFKVGWKRWHQKIEYKRKRYEAGDFEG